MNKEQFTNYLQDPILLNAGSVSELSDIVQKFPYCQSAHILLTLNLYKEENILYNAHLKTTAVYAGNRRVLKQIIDQLDLSTKSIAPNHSDTAIVEEEFPLPTPVIESAEIEKTKPEKTKRQLLDEFIKTQPSITRNKEPFYSAAEASRKSIVDQENIISETLADIYYDQKHFKKAINIYEKLSLKYPEKSIYFAALIKKAKKELKS